MKRLEQERISLAPEAAPRIPMENVSILLLCIAAAVGYGVVHDQVTARLCLEYFTIAHRPVQGIETPTAIAFYWGFAATWWVGVLLGIPMMAAARAGTWPRLGALDLLRPISMLLLGMALCALAAGLVGSILFRHGIVSPGAWGQVIPPEKHWGFVVNLFSHSASYLSGLVGGVVLIFLVLRKRRKMGAISSREA